MKTKLLLLFVISGAWLNAQISIPDPNFEQALIDLGHDTDGAINGQISEVDAQAVTLLYVNDNEITSLEGIEAFVNITDLRFHNNQVASVDLSSNTALTILVSQNNPLTSLDLSQNVNLTQLYSDNTTIENLTFSNPSPLTALNISGASVTTIDLSNMPDLEQVDISNTGLSNIDLTNNTQLLYLNITNTNTTSLNLTQNTNLLEVGVTENNLTELDLSQNTLLQLAYLGRNRFTTFTAPNLPNLKTFGINTQQDGFKLASLDISALTNLETLYAETNELTSINVTSNTQLNYINIGENQISTIDLSSNTLLSEFFAYGGTLETIDLSSNSDLNVVNLDGNNLTSVNAANGNNTNLSELNIRDNSNLFCIQVDNVELAYNELANDLWGKDEQALYETDCNNPLSGVTVSVPDDNLEARLINLGVDRSGNMDNLITLSEALNTTFLDLNGLGINNPTGLESFKNLTGLNLGENNLSFIDVSTMSRLIYLDVYNNNLTDLDLDNNPEVSELYIGQNNITDLDVSQLNLRDFFIHDNPIQSVDLANSTSLERFYAYDCNLISVDVSNSENLIVLSLDRNNLSSLNLANGNNAILNEFYVHDNPNLFCIQVDNIEQAYSKRAEELWGKDDQALYETDCNNPSSGFVNVPDNSFEQGLINLGIDRSGIMDDKITVSEALNTTFLELDELGISNPQGLEAFKYLTGLRLFDNNLSFLDLSTMTNLDYIDVYGNNLTELDLSNNPNMAALYIGDNNIESIDVSALNLREFAFEYNSINTVDLANSTNLEYLQAAFNNLTELDLSNNPNLDRLFVEGNALTILDIKNGNTNGISEYNSVNNTGLFCVQVDDVNFANNNFLQKDTATNFSTDCDYQLSTDEFELSSNVNFYPNPASSEIQIDTLEIITSVSIMNLTGKIVKTIKGNTNNINVSDLSNGVYFIKISTVNATVVEKLIKN
ncbi:T9SS type A sorting domain-containing protein [Winogradskyella bathintestinalis]|uniref:T9SS type A sorting domain-containing protein n=1 Tax=Winogradskyella bathintestinalis TaxID=3035208 RepID=A0ABT7ZSA7_9FLAO|nr:T9SS type A sorting domain-containing protein [Winogradskyella bathintestinalis]MDN3491890.1 T9SS type A sorting domain-containing protein [Winogradskyella bathintestinalis]